MTQNDSFIHEVSEEVRRDQLFGLLRKYGWILGLALVLVVGGAGVNEYLKAKARAEAQASGDAMLAALALPDPVAQAAELSKLAEGGGKAALLAQFQQAASLQQAGDIAGSAAVLDAIAAAETAPQLLRDMARLKSVMVQGDGLAASERLAVLDVLAQPGQPLRMLALEQRALVHVAGGSRDAALADLTTVFESAEASQSLQQRAALLIVALGGKLPQAEPVKVQ